MTKITKRFKLMKDDTVLAVLHRIDSDFPWHICDFHENEAFEAYRPDFEARYVAGKAYLQDMDNEKLRRKKEAAFERLQEHGFQVVEFTEDGDDWEITYNEPEELFILNLKENRAFLRF